MFAVLLEDGNVGIPGGLGGVVSGEGGVVGCLNGLTLGVYGGWDLGWEESDLSEIEIGGSDGTDGGGGWRNCVGGESGFAPSCSWEVGDVTPHLGAGGKRKRGCSDSVSVCIATWCVPVG